MGLVYADIEIVNTDDLALVRRGYLEAGAVRKLSAKVLVDSGAYMMCINESHKTQLGLSVIDHMSAELANGSVVALEVVGPVEIRFGNRRTSCNAAVLPGNAEPLLGSIPMEDLDVVINPRSQTLEVNPESPFIAKKKIK